MAEEGDIQPDDNIPAAARAQHACSNLGEIWALNFHRSRRSGRSVGRQTVARFFWPNPTPPPTPPHSLRPESVKCDRLHRARSSIHTIIFITRNNVEKFSGGENTKKEKDKDGREGKSADRPSVRPSEGLHQNTKRRTDGRGWKRRPGAAQWRTKRTTIGKLQPQMREKSSYS